MRATLGQVKESAKNGKGRTGAVSARLTVHDVKVGCP